MKKTNYFILAAAAALFAACSSDDDLVVQQEASPQSEQAVTFSAYVNRGTTRAGYQGELKTANLQETGFGVFGYYTDNELYSESSKPNFFYNQQVSGANWTYSPLKYWPNEYGTAAISEAQDKLTFFAYAPWVEVVPETGLLKEQSGNNSGIVALTRNTASGDPYVKYMVDMEPAKCVDFCWGVAKDNFTSSVEGTLNNITAGEVYKNVSKPAVNSKIAFDFHHALASLNVQIDADIDQDVHGDNALAAETKIFVRSVTFEGFASKGMFNLNANKDQPKWYDLTGNNELTSGKVTIYDGRRDGSEGQINAAAANEIPNDLNPKIIQNNPATVGVPSGTDPVNLFNSTSATAPVYVIPVSDEQLKVTIVYDVETKDDNLANYLSDGETKGSTIENTITKPITLSSGNALKLIAGKMYTVKLHLGMTSVKFEASVTDWIEGDTGEPWLPINTGVSAGSISSFVLDAAATSGSFVVSGLTVGNFLHTSGTTGVANTQVNGTYYTGTGIEVPATKEATITYTLTAANTSVSNKTYTITANERDGASNLKTSTVANVTQLAKPFVLQTPTISVGQTTVHLSAGFGSGVVTQEEWQAADIKVEMYNDETSKYDEIAISKGTASASGIAITIPAAVSGKLYKITVKVGDAESNAKEVTVS